MITPAVIRPAARHILTIGRGLIKDNYTALVELVKNAYDAEATEVIIEFSKIIENDIEKLKISIEDDGHGMTSSNVLLNWLVPSTDNKAKNEFSKNRKRKVQGKKGIGRYASAILGNDLLMKTIDEDNHEKTEVYIQWSAFEDPKYTYLDEVPILVESTKGNSNEKGTLLQIISDIRLHFFFFLDI